MIYTLCKISFPCLTCILPIRTSLLVILSSFNKGVKMINSTSLFIIFLSEFLYFFYQPNYQNNCCILESPLEFWFSSLENSDNEDFFLNSHLSLLCYLSMFHSLSSPEKKPNQIYYYYAYSQGTVIFIEILNFIKWLRRQSQKLFVARAE